MFGTYASNDGENVIEIEAIYNKLKESVDEAGKNRMFYDARL